MENNNQFDQQFHILRQAEEDAPMHLWPEILEKIKEKPKRDFRFFWYSFLGFTLLSIGTISGYLLIANQDAKQITSRHAELISEAIFNEKTASSTSIKSLHILPAKNEKATFLRSDKKTAEWTKISPSNNQPKQNISIQRKQTTSIKTIAYERSALEPKAQINNINNKLTNHSLPAADTKTTVKEEVNSNQKIRTTKRNLIQEVVNKDNQINAHEKTPNDIPNINPDKKCDGSRVIKVPTSFFVDAYISPVIGSTFFTGNTAEAKSYAKLRDSTEKNGVGILTGIRFGYIHSSGLNVRAGLAYQQMQTKFKHTIEEDEKMIVTTIRDNQGSVIGRDTTFEFGRRDLKIINRYRTVDIPISVGYISMKNKVQLGFHAGAVINLNFSQKGTYLDQNFKLAAFEDNRIFNKNIGASFFGSIELQHLLGENWGIFVEPQIRFYPKSLTISAHPVKHNITSFNLLTGIKYIF